jgi:hypothetical protein
LAELCEQVKRNRNNQPRAAIATGSTVVIDSSGWCVLRRTSALGQMGHALFIAAIFGALDRGNDTVYLTGEHYRGQAEPAVHALAIKARGKMRGFIDPASNASSQIDGKKLFGLYKGLGLDLLMADNARESGIFEVWSRLSTGRLKVFKSCRNWLSEFRTFARDENGQIVNEAKYHLQAATRYLLLGSLNRWGMPHPTDSSASLRARRAVKGHVWG